MDEMEEMNVIPQEDSTKRSSASAEKNYDDNIDDTDSSESDSDSDDGKADSQEVEMLDANEYNRQLQTLEANIYENSSYYQAYIDIINLTKSNMDFDKLRAYRQKMIEVFPMDKRLWLDWLKDEQKLITNDEERSKVKELFETSLNDYLSVEIWLEYIQFSIGDMGKPGGLENIRKICERSIELAGLDVANGYLLWEAYREFESAILSGLQASSAGSIQTEEQKKQVTEQIERIITLFKRQIGTCLENTKNTYLEFEEFDDTKIDKDIEFTYKQTLQKYQTILPFEMALKNLSTDEGKKLTEYKNYLDFEMKFLRSKDPASMTHSKSNRQQNGKQQEDDQEVTDEELSYYRLRIKCLFERAIADNTNCLDASLWLKYIYFLNEEDASASSPKTNKFYLKVSQRSVRNCPWSAKLWINYTFNLEKQAFLNNIDSSSMVKGVFNQALNSALQTSDDYLQVWHAYLDFLKRGLDKDINEEKTEEIRDAFQKAIDQLYECFKHNGDPAYSLEKYSAHVEAKYFKNMVKARKIYNESILSRTDSARFSQIWLEFFEIEKEFGDLKHQRKLLNRALNEVNMDEKQIIYDVFLQFEKMNGNVQQHANIYFRNEQFKEISQLIAARKKTKSAQKDQQSGQMVPQKATTSHKETKTKPVDRSNSLKRKKSESSEDSIENNQNKKLPGKDKDGFVIPSLPFAPPVAVPEKPTVVKTPVEAVSTDTKKSSEHYKKFSDHTIFISNLSYDLDETKLAAVFEKSPGFKEIRLVRGWNGISKGYGYVDFDSVENATEALKLDRSLIDTRPLFVSKNTDKSQEVGTESKLKYATNLEKNKLFISGLPFTMNKSGLEEILEKFGKLKEVRIVVYKNGRSKGLAYAEFEDEVSAKNALLKTDGMLIGENQITVAISNPPKRKDFEADKSNEKARSLGSGSYKTAAQAPSKASSGATSSFSFVPRSQVIGGRKKTLSFK